MDKRVRTIKKQTRGKRKSKSAVPSFLGNDRQQSMQRMPSPEQAHTRPEPSPESTTWEDAPITNSDEQRQLVNHSSNASSPDNLKGDVLED